jgi:outer membrane protein assembly factor BamD
MTIRASILIALVPAFLIAQGTRQPDRVLYDSAISDIQHSRFERARLTLQTLVNTYSASEYLAQAKLAIADSWYREGGTRGLAQAEAECKDLIKFYPNDPETSKAQELLKKIQDARAKQK